MEVLHGAAEQAEVDRSGAMLDSPAEENGD
jgi:hypothetical protein